MKRENWIKGVCKVIAVGEEFAIEDILDELPKSYKQPKQFCTCCLSSSDRFTKTEEEVVYYHHRKQTKYIWKRIK